MDPVIAQAAADNRLLGMAMVYFYFDRAAAAYDFPGYEYKHVNFIRSTNGLEPMDNPPVLV